MKHYFTLLLMCFCTSLCSIEEEWEEMLRQRFDASEKEEEDFRQFDENTSDDIKAFYYENHTKQTVDFVLSKKEQYAKPTRTMGIWEAMQLLDTIVDASDPDISLPQSYHAYQTAEALRKDGHPRWLIFAGFIHDLGKVLTCFGEPQWAVVGDTFPVGCAYSDRIVFHDYFRNNPDSQVPQYQSKFGIYSEGCGFDKLLMSWGHDEYLYQVTKHFLPEEALYIIRYHSFYPAHLEKAYGYFMDDYDRKMMPWVKLFNKYDLYSKADEEMNIEDLKEYYRELVEEFLPMQIDW